jgi:pimeloyl-ACP methyl ester carboxylesterase
MPRTREIYRSEQGRRAVEDFYRRVLSADPVAWQTRLAETDQGRVHLIEAGPGAGEVLLLLHGSASNSATWLGDIPAWSRRFRVVAVDIPGHPGLSEGPPLALSRDDAAGWLLRVLEVVGAERARIAGMSLGGWVALAFACRHPDRVRALSLISPGGLAPARGTFLLKALPLALLGDRGSDHIQRLVFGAVEVPQPVLEFARLVARHYRPLTQRLPVFGDGELRRLQMPIQFLGGTGDALIRAEESAARLSRLLPHAQIRLLPGSGHAIIGQTENILSFFLGS